MRRKFNQVTILAMKNYLRLTSKAVIAAVLTTGLCLATPTHAADTAHGKSKLSANDKKFVKKAYRGGMEEVANAKMAQDKAKDEATKKVAERMIADHTKANEDLMSIANEEHLDLSSIHPKPATISGSDFDKEYLRMLQKDHKKDIAMFETEANDVKPGEDRDVPSFAKKTLPTLKEHLQMIEDALAKMK
jgi:putative membrane protein